MTHSHQFLTFNRGTLRRKLRHTPVLNPFPKPCKFYLGTLISHLLSGAGGLPLSHILNEYHDPRTPLLTVLIPAKNEEQLIRHTLLAVDRMLTSHHIPAEIIVIDDGSDDQTSRVVAETAPLLQSALRMLREKHSRGKGGALIQGFAASRADYVAFIDADLEYPPDAIPPMLEALEQDDQNACAIAVRTVDTRSWWERATSRFAHSVVSLCLQVPVKDTQAGLKMFPGWFARQVLANAKETGWLFDLEALSQAQSHKLKIWEVPVRQTARRPRRATFGTMMSCLPAFVRIMRDHWTNREGGRLGRFLGVGLVNTSVDLLVYTALVGLIPPDHRWWAASLESFISWGLATLVSRTLHSRITFQYPLAWSGFSLVTLTGLSVQLAATALLAHVLGSVGAIAGKFLGGSSSPLSSRISVTDAWHHPSPPHRPP